MKLILALSIVLASCNPLADLRKGEPKLIQGLSSNFKEGTAQLTQRVQARFPDGTPEATLVKQLKQQQFGDFAYVPDEEGGWHSASFEERGFPCITGWSIRWRSKEGRLTKVWAVYGASCL
jgi:hypothetical protein